MQEKTRQSLDLLSRNKSEVHPLLPADARTTSISLFSPDHQPSNLPKYHPKKKQHQNPNENLKKITEKSIKKCSSQKPKPSNIPPTSLHPQVETQAVEKEVEVPMVLRQEVIVETPQLVVAEVIREMPQEMTQPVVKEVPKFQSLELPRVLMKMGPVKYLKNPENGCESTI